MAPAAFALEIAVASNNVVNDIVVARPANASRNGVQVQVKACLPGYVVVCTGRVSTDAQPTEYVAIGVV